MAQVVKEMVLEMPTHERFGWSVFGLRRVAAMAVVELAHAGMWASVMMLHPAHPARVYVRGAVRAQRARVRRAIASTR